MSSSKRSYLAGHKAACTHGIAKPGFRVKNTLHAYMVGFRDGLKYKAALADAVAMGYIKSI